MKIRLTPQPRQTRPTQALARRIRHAYRSAHCWQSAAESCGITGRDGLPSRGLAWRIAHGYEPRTRAVRERLGLPPLRRPPVNPLLMRIEDMPPQVLRYAIEHREEMTG